MNETNEPTSTRRPGVAARLRRLTRDARDLPSRVEALQGAVGSAVEALQDTVDAVSARLARLEGRLAAGMAPHERSLRSVDGGDGILRWLFSRIGTSTRTFVELGPADARTSATAHLGLDLGWSGLLVARDPKLAKASHAFYDEALADHLNRVSVVHAQPSRSEVHRLITESITPDPDLLAVDAGGNEYWIWERLANAGLRPRLVTVSYNAALGADRRVSSPYLEDVVDDTSASSTSSGVSLAALDELGRMFGYVLAGCDSRSDKAYFVRADLADPIAPDLPFGPAEAYGPSPPRVESVQAAAPEPPMLAVPRHKPARVQGHLVHVDRADSLKLRRHEVYEPLETEVIACLVRPGDCVLDLGAHVGYYTLLSARLAGHDGRVVAFEPDPENYALLVENVELNGYESVVCEQKAVAGQSGCVRLFRSVDNLADHRIHDPGDGRAHITVEALRIDDYPLESVDVVKIDIQGAEYAAVDGMRDTIARSAGIRLVTEFWPLGLGRAGVDPVEYLRLIASLGFVLWVMDESAWTIRRVDRTDFEAVALAAMRTTGTGHTNILCLRPGVEPPDPPRPPGDQKV